MKKILAFVLCMIMCFALCATAFADTSSKTDYGTETKLTSGDWVVYPIDNNEKTDFVLDKHVGQSVRTVVTDGVTTISYIPAYFVASGTGLAADEVLVECTEACADYRVFKNNSLVCYVNVDYVPMQFMENATFVKGVKNGSCGSYPQDVYVIDGVGYAAVSSGGSKGVCDGKFIQYGDIVPSVAHTWDIKNVTYKGTKGEEASIPVSIKCSKCGNSFSVVAAGKLPGDYIGDVDKEFFATYWILLGNKSVPAVIETATDTSLKSPKTGDAGIAMYAMMGLTSVMGLAGCGKKKKFAE